MISHRSFSLYWLHLAVQKFSNARKKGKNETEDQRSIIFQSHSYRFQERNVVDQRWNHSSTVTLDLPVKTLPSFRHHWWLSSSTTCPSRPSTVVCQGETIDRSITVIEYRTLRPFLKNVVRRPDYYLVHEDIFVGNELGRKNERKWTLIFRHLRWCLRNGALWYIEENGGEGEWTTGEDWSLIFDL